MPLLSQVLPVTGMGSGRINQCFPKLKEDVFYSTPAGTSASLQTRIESVQAYIKRLEQGNRTPKIVEELAGQRKLIGQWEKKIREKQEEFTSFDVQLPQSYAYYSITAESASRRTSTL